MMTQESTELFQDGSHSLDIVADPSQQRAQSTILDDPKPPQLSGAQNSRGVISFSASYNAAMDYA